METVRKPWRSFLFFMFLGVLAVLTLLPMYIEIIPEQLAEFGIPLTIPVHVIALLSLINPLLFIIAGLVVGHLLASRTGLVSFVYETDRFRRPFWSRLVKVLKPAILFGFLGGIIVMSVEFLIQPLLPSELQMAGASGSLSLIDFASRMLYGGVAEELMLRWGVMTLLAFLLWKIFSRKKLQPSPLLMWISIVLSALLFAIGHFGATAAITEITGIVLFRMLFLNGFLGLIYGWLFWKKGLEAAMIAHMVTHITLIVITFIFL